MKKNSPGNFEPFMEVHGSSHVEGRHDNFIRENFNPFYGSMEIKVNEKSENPLLKRQKIKFEVEHPAAPTPPRVEVLGELSSELGVSKDLIVIEKIATLHGRQTASGIARVYESESQLKELEPEHLIERTKASEEKTIETEEEAKEEEEEVEEPEEAEKELEEAPEEKAEPKEEEAEEAPEGEEVEAEEKVEEEAPEEAEEITEEEEIDYQSLSKKNIPEIKKEVEESELDYQKLLKAEKENKNRKTLKKWLKEKTEASGEK